jgi:hypothetical protein
MPKTTPDPVSTADRDRVFRALTELTGGHLSGGFARGAKSLLDLDLYLGCIAGIGIGLAAALSKHVLAEAIIVLTTQVLLGGGLLAVVLAALAILTTFFDEKYREALGNASGGFARVVFPFKVVAFAGALASGSGILTIAFWGLLPHTLRAVLFGLVGGSTVWAVIGTWQLVMDITFHGVKRAELLELDRIESLFRDSK